MSYQTSDLNKGPKENLCPKIIRYWHKMNYRNLQRTASNPGSTFKIITTLEYIRENPDYENYSYCCNGSITENDFTIHFYNNAVHGTQDLKQSFANSCNSSYANIGLSSEIMESQSAAIVFGSKSGLDTMASTFPVEGSITTTAPS